LKKKESQLREDILNKEIQLDQLKEDYESIVNKNKLHEDEIERLKRLVESLKSSRSDSKPSNSESRDVETVTTRTEDSDDENPKSGEDTDDRTSTTSDKSGEIDPEVLRKMKAEREREFEMFTEQERKEKGLQLDREKQEREKEKLKITEQVSENRMKFLELEKSGIKKSDSHSSLNVEEQKKIETCKRKGNERNG